MAKFTDFSKIKKNTKFSEHQIYSVEKIVGDEIQLKNSHGENIIVNKDYVENCLISSDQYSNTEKKSRTEMFQVLLSNPNTVFTVSFQKQVKQVDVEKEIQEAYDNSTPKEFGAKLKKAVKKALDGEERILIGKHSGNVDTFGRLNVIDLEIETGYNNRLVDSRGINWLIINNTKYTEK